MAVALGVAVAGEVLGHGLHAAVLEAAGVGDDLAGDVVGVVAEGARAYDGVARVGVDIGDRGEVDLHAQGATLARRLASVGVN